MSRAGTIAEVELPLETTTATEATRRNGRAPAGEGVPAGTTIRRPVEVSRSPHHSRTLTPPSSAIHRQCELCGGTRAHGGFLVASPRKPPVWACDDCQQMLLLCVDDRGTPGD